jgi:hypothetical protein
MTMQPQNSQDADSDDIAEPRATPASSGIDTRTDAGADRPEPRDERPHDIEERRPLFDENELGGYRSRWTEVQARFVDDPRGTVKEADALVNDVVQRLTQTFTDERASLESQWSEGKDASTEDLRVAMQRYRSFFARLLSA